MVRDSVSCRQTCSVSLTLSHSGPYATAILRFQISFPDSYPRLPPLVTFSTDIFHPLITPLSTYTYTTDIQDNGTVSATDDERLPPGGFSLRHGFPNWFGRGSKILDKSSRQVSSQHGPDQTPPRATRGIQSAGTTPDSKNTPAGESLAYMQTTKDQVSTYEVLRYIKSTFDDEDVLDSVPLEAAGNPSAWHAWRTHRRAGGKVYETSWHDGLGDSEGSQGASTDSNATKPAGSPAVARRPGEWNWGGVWEDRVKKGIAASLSEPVLYGGAGATDELVSVLSRHLSACSI
jgi:hypothetical protein